LANSVSALCEGSTATPTFHANINIHYNMILQHIMRQQCYNKNILQRYLKQYKIILENITVIYQKYNNAI